MADVKKGGIAATVKALALPHAKKLGLEIWDVTYAKEGPDRHLCVYIDSPHGVDIDDCEKMSRALNDEIDALDINEEFFFEVSSPGLGRILRTDDHLAKFTGEKINARLIRPDADGNKEYTGLLREFTGDSVKIDTDNGAVMIFRKDVAAIKLCDDEDLGRYIKE